MLRRPYSPIRSVLGLVCALVLLGIAPGRATAENHLTLTVHPYLSAAEVIERFTPLANRLSRVLGREVRVQVAESYDEHLRTIGEGRADIAYLGPVSYVQLNALYGVQHLLARQADKGAPTFHGAIVVRADSDIEALADLKGKRFAFGSMNSTMSHVIPHVMLHDAGVEIRDLGAFEFVGSHKTVAISVLAGKFDAGGVKMEIVDQFKDRGLRVLAVSDAVSEHLFVAGPNLSKTDRDAARQALLALHADPDGQAALHAIKPTLTSFMPVVDADYDALRRVMRVYDQTVKVHDHINLKN